MGVHFLQRKKWLWDNLLVSSTEMPPVPTWEDLNEWNPDMYQVPEVSLLAERADWTCIVVFATSDNPGAS